MLEYRHDWHSHSLYIENNECTEDISALISNSIIHIENTWEKSMYMYNVSLLKPLILTPARIMMMTISIDSE